MAEIISYPEKSILSGNDYLLISDSQNSYITKKTKVSDINALVFSNAIEGSGTTNYIPKFTSTKLIGDSIIYNGTDTISIGAETNVAESRLNVYKTSDMTTAAPHVATFNEASSDHSASLWPGSGNNSADIYGSVSRSTFTGSGTLDQLMGANPVSRHSGSGTIQFVQGVQTTASLQGDGTAEFIYATYSKANINGTANTNVDAAIGGWHVAELNGENNVDDIYGTISNVMLTKGTVNTSAVAHLLDFDQVPADTTVSNVYYIKAENDNLTATGEKFFIKEETGLPSQFSNKLILNSYGSGTYTGTATQKLAVDTNGNVIEIPIGSGPVDGSGTANYLTKWIDSDTIGNSIAYDSGSQLLLNATSAAFGAKLYVNGDSYVTGGYQVGTASTYVGKLVNSSGVLTLETNSNRDIQFKSSANVFMYIDDDSLGGKVGIGTTSPTQKVVIKKSSYGSVDIGATVASGATLLAAGVNDDYGTFFATQGSSDNYTGLIQQRRQSAATFYNLSLNPYGGNVGIGTSSPLGKLQVNEYTVGSQGNQNVHGEFSVFADSGNESLFLGVKNATYPNRGWAFNPVANGVNSDLQIKEHGASGVRMTLQSAGNVGIGTTSPSSKLEIAGSGNQKLLVNRTDGDNFYIDAQNGQIRLRGSNNIYMGVSGDLLTVTNTNVGIGTTSPGAPLHVAGEVRVDPGDAFMFDAPNNIYAVAAQNQFRLYSGGNPVINVPTSGNVGIGTTSPSAKLDVHGTSYFFDQSIFDDKVGIGTSSPSEKLEVDGNIKVIKSGQSPNISVFHSDGSYAKLRGQGLFLSRATSYVAPEADNFGSLAIGYNGARWGNVEINAATVKFENGANEWMRINSSGNVGIGTTSPISKLHIVETGTISPALFIDTTRYGASIVGDGTSNSQYLLNLQSNGGSTDVMRVQSSGNVGIGTTSPSGPLHVKSSTNSNIVYIDTSANALGDNAYINFNGSRAQVGWIDAAITLTDGGGNKDIKLKVNTGSIFLMTSNTARMFVSSSGNVGIGTTSPNKKLVIKSGGADDGINLKRNSNDAVIANLIETGSGDGALLLATNTGVTKTLLRGDGNNYINGGNLGIGTTSPARNLHVVGSGTTVATKVEATDGSQTSLDLQNNEGWFRLINDGGSLSVYDQADSVERFRINTSGNVGIGATNPQAKLDISTTGTGDSMIIRNNDASSSAAPVLMLLRDSASAANGDYLGQIKFKGNSDTGAERVYAKITAKISDATNGAEDSLIETAVRDNGSNLIVSRQTHQNLKLINGTGLESDGDIYMPVIGKGPIIRSPDGTRYRIIVDNSGNLSTETA